MIVKQEPVVCKEVTQKKATSSNSEDFYALAKSKIKAEIKLSAIDPAVAKLNLEFLPDVEYDEVVKEATDTPLDNALGRKYSRFTHQVTHRLGIGFRQGYQLDNGIHENFEYWQVKVFSDRVNPQNQKTGQYLAPSQIGNRVYFPNVPDSIIEKIEQKYNVTFDRNIDFWENILNHKSIPIEITEGGKKALSVVSNGTISISMYGCTCYNSPDLIPFIQGRKVILTLDRDPQKSQGFKAVNQAIKEFNQLVKKQKGNLTIRVWNSTLGKGIDDFIYYCYTHNLDWQKESTLFNVKKYFEYLNFNSQDKKSALTQKIKEFYQFTPDHIINADYLSGDKLAEVINPYLKENKQFSFNIKSGLGSNKTGSIIELIKSSYEPLGCNVLAISDLNTTLYQFQSRFNQCDDSFGGIYPFMKHLHKDDAYEELDYLGMVLTFCLQSFHHLAGKDLSKTIVVFDEKLSIVKTLIEGSTFTGNSKYSSAEIQQIIYQELARVIRQCLHVYNLDGNLSDSCIDVDKTLASNRQQVNILCLPINPKKFDITMVDDFIYQYYMMKDCALSNIKFAFTSDSKEECRKHYQLLLEWGINQDRIIIADSEKDAPKEFYENPTKYIKDHDILALIYSPACNRAFDVSGDMFEYQFNWYKNVFGIDQIDQQMFRIRSEKTKRFVTISNDVKYIERPNKFSTNHNNLLVEQLRLIRENDEHLETSDEMILSLIKAHFNHPLDVFETKVNEFEKATRGENLALAFKCFMEYKGQVVKTEVTESLEGDESVINAYHCVNHDSSLRENYVNLRQEIKNQVEEAKKNKLIEKASLVAIAPETIDELNDLKEVDPTLEKVTASHITLRNNLEQRIPTFTSSQSFTPENIALLLDQENNLYQTTFRLACLLKGYLPFNRTQKLTQLILKDFRDNGFMWINSFNDESNIIHCLSRIGLGNFFTQYDPADPTAKDNYFTFDDPSLLAMLKKLTPEDIQTLDLNKKSQLKDSIKVLKQILKLIGFTTAIAKKVQGKKYFQLVPLIAKKKEGQKFTFSNQDVEKSLRLINDLLSGFFLKIDSYVGVGESTVTFTNGEFNQGVDHLNVIKEMDDRHPTETKKSTSLLDKIKTTLTKIAQRIFPPETIYQYDLETGDEAINSLPHQIQKILAEVIDFEKWINHQSFDF